MQIHFSSPDSSPERLVAEAAIHFDEGPLAGTRLVGFAIWRGADGALYVTVPSRATGTGSGRRFFDLVRGVESFEAVKATKAAILEAYKDHFTQAA